MDNITLKELFIELQKLERVLPPDKKNEVFGELKQYAGQLKRAAKKKGAYGDSNASSPERLTSGGSHV